jgi:hypothetical protein
MKVQMKFDVAGIYLDESNCKHYLPKLSCRVLKILVEKWSANFGNSKRKHYLFSLVHKNNAQQNQYRQRHWRLFYNKSRKNFELP